MRDSHSRMLCSRETSSRRHPAASGGRGRERRPPLPPPFIIVVAMSLEEVLHPLRDVVFHRRGSTASVAQRRQVDVRLCVPGRQGWETTASSTSNVTRSVASAHDG